MKIRSKLQTWFLITIVFIVIAVITLSISISLQVDNLFIDYRSSVDKIGLEQAQETFNLLDTTAQDIVLKIHSNPPTTLLSLAPSIEKVSPMFIRSFMQMRDLVLPFVKSINVIHVPTGKIITTNQGWTRVTGSLIDDVESAYPALPLLTPLPLETVVSVDNKKELVFAYLFRERFPDEKGLSRGVILLIDSSWFLNAVSAADDIRTGTRFLLYHPRLGILGENSDTSPMNDLSKTLRYTINDDLEPDSFSYILESTSHVIDYQVLGNSDLYLIRMRDETILQKEIIFLRLKITGIALVFLILVLTGALMVNKQIYQPFYSIVEQIRESMGKRLSMPENDLDLLNALYGNLRDEYSDSGEDRIINNCLRSLSQEDLENKEEIIDILNKRGVNISENKPGCLCLISIDDFDEEFNIQPPDSLSSYTALKYQFRNETSKALSELRLGSTGIFLRRGVMLLLLYSSETGISPNRATVSVIHKMISEFMETSISLIQSELFYDLSDLRQKYLRLSASLRHRYLHGRGISLLEENKQISPTDEERTMVKGIRTNIIKNISDQNLSSVELKSYLDILRNWIVTAVQDEINVFSLSLTRALSNKDADFQTQELFKNLINQPTLDDFHTIVEDFTKEKEGAFNLTESRHSALIDLARDMIEKSYSNPGLSMTSLADDLKMSPTYFGMIFKKTVGTSFNDYLSMVRIQEAARLLKNTRDSVQEIMVSVGIQSESTFYRKFRDIFNLTPQLYRQQSILNSGDNKKNV